jgi:hypothetical protein
MPSSEKWFYALLAFEQSDAIDLKNRIESVINNPNALQRNKELAYAIKQSVSQRWNITYQSTNYIVVWMAGKQKWKDIIFDQYPNTVIVGVFKQDGLQVGQSWAENNTVEGTPTYPWITNAFNVFPEIPVFDRPPDPDDSVQIGTRPFTGLDMLLFCGQIRPLVWQE